jgi:proline iminopeptidase
MASYEVTGKVWLYPGKAAGISSRSPPNSLTRCIADIEFLRRHFGHELWLAPGHSWGAGLALRYALAHPGRILGVRYVSGTGFGQAWRAAYHGEAERRRTPAQRDAALNDEEKQTIEADVLDCCRALDVPVRVVHGARELRPVWAVESLVAALPRVELTVIDGVGHLPWLEDPAAFVRVASEFVLDVADRVDLASPDAPGPRGRDDPTGSRQTR